MSLANQLPQQPLPRSFGGRQNPLRPIVPQAGANALRHSAHESLICGVQIPLYKHVVGILKAELKRRHLSYRDLAQKLEAIGVHDSERNITNKVNRGTFTAAFFVQCLEAIGCQVIRLEDQ